MTNGTEVIDPVLMAKRARGTIEIKEIQKRLNCSRSHVGDLIYGVNGEPPVLPSFKSGTRRLVYICDFEEYLYRLGENG